MKPTVLLIGLGHLGGAMLELLARDADIGPIIACDLAHAGGEARCNLARLGAMAQGFAPQIEYRSLDITADGAVAETVHQVGPDLVLSTASLQTWWLLDLLPPEQQALLKSARFGVWLPVHMTLSYRLMQVLADAGYQGVSMTAPFPDVVNCILGRRGMAPTCGVGNLDEIVPKVGLLAANRLDVGVDRLRIFLVAHHALESPVFGGSTDPDDVPPYFLRVELDGRDVTEEVEADRLLLDPCPLPDGPAWSWLTAGSTVRLARSVFAREDTLLHVPAPGGLPGGYPVIAGNREIRLAPIDGCTPEEAVAINEQSHRFDGIERIEEDGTAVLVERSAEIMNAELGFDCARLHPDEAPDRARELMARFREYALRYGVDLATRSSTPA
jgi:hypothetical protein